MLLRSSSTPLLNSCNTMPKDPVLSPEPEFLHRIPRSRSIVALAASSGGPSSPPDSSIEKMRQALSEVDLRRYGAVSKRSLFSGSPDSVVEREEEEDGEEDEDEDHDEDEGESWGRLLTTSGLGERVAVAEMEEEVGCLVREREMTGLAVCDGSGGFGGTGSGRRYGGGGSGGGSDGGKNRDHQYYGRGSTDLYYQKMIEANPGSSLVLGNYAKFLKEIRGDLVKAEEYCGRAILANPGDANVLSMFGDLIWQSQKDGAWAETYFGQAVKAAPDDCYVLASYAHFLWDSGEEEGGDCETSTAALPYRLHGVPPGPPPIAAAY